MPRLDVSDVLTDSYFCDATLQCERHTLTTDVNGRGVTRTVLSGFAGVVTSDKGQLLERGVIGEYATGTILVVTRFLLRDAGVNSTADVVRWNSGRYTVKQILPYSTYGRGFIEAICELVPLAGVVE